MAKKIIGAALFIFVIFLFCYFRLKPLYFQTVGYTYDQGRDFLKAAEIIQDKNITFIGPTAGIQGLFHGALYYYLLTIPFLIFKGAPIGFYYFNFFIQFVSFVFFAYFLHKFFGSQVSLIISLLIASSPYFIFTSIFVGNNIMVLPVFLAFLIANFYLLEKKIKKPQLLLLIIGLLLGFTTEFELAFGLFLIPVYLLITTLLKNFRSIFYAKKNFLLFLSGLFIPFIPRLLFELKNNFMQTRILWSYLMHPSGQNTRLYSQIVQERINLFYGYFTSLFVNDFLFKIFFILFILTAYFFLENKIKKYHYSVNFFLLLIIFLFFLSTLNNGGFFWGNYFEGIQYLILIILASILSFQLQTQSVILDFLKVGVLIVIFLLNLNSILKSNNSKPNAVGTLKLQTQVVNYIFQKEQQMDTYCVKVYTPPVIPHTYNYLFLYGNISKHYPLPKNDWVKRKCWYIVETDENNERRTEWLEKNIPRKAKTAHKKLFNDVEIILYELN